MPITQDRMIDLIHAARDFEQAADRTRQHILQEHAIAQRPNPMFTPEERYKAALDNILLLANPKDLMNELLKSHRTLDQEEFHFRKMGARNASERRRQNNRRNGIPASAPKPASTNHTEKHTEGLSTEAKATIDRELQALDLTERNQAAALSKFNNPKALDDFAEAERIRREYQGEDDELDGKLEF